MDTPPAQDPLALEAEARRDTAAAGPAPRHRMSRRARIGWTVGVGVAVVLGSVGTYVHVTAHTSFDEAAARLDAAITEAAKADETLTEAIDASSGAVTAAQTIVGDAADDLVDPDARAALADAATAATGGLASAEDISGGSIGDLEEKPFWTWELLGLAPELESRADTTITTADDMLDAAAALEQSEGGLVEAATALYATAAPAAAALEAANNSARNLVVLDFRDAAEAVAGQTRLGSGATVAMATYAQRARALKESAQSELAEKAGPLLATRLEIEAFARSIAGGVVLDFDWAPIVAGTGGRQGIGGTATWNTVRGGFSTITLSHSVAERWPDADARALVAHEVGHSITSKCYDKFDSQDQAANEEWATAWAIGMGYTAQGNGTWAYGYPSQAMIDVAATCR